MMTVRFRIGGVSLRQPAVLWPHNGAMAGRPRKDPAGLELVRCVVKMRQDVKRVAQVAARSHGLTLTDYLCALIAEDNPTELTSVPLLQEVLPESA